MVTHTYVNLEIEEARYLADLVGIQYDLRTTIEWCDQYTNLALKSDSYWLVEPMTTAILTRFIRVFGGGIRMPKVKHILTILGDEEKVQYEYFKNIRDKHIAHSVNEFESNHIKMYFIEGAAEKGVTSIGYGCDRIVGLSRDDIGAIINVCKALMSKVESEIELEKSKLLTHTSGYTENDIKKFIMKTPKSSKEIEVSKNRK